jgi:hypothetical protein
MIMNLEKKYTTQSFYLHVVVGTHTKGVEGVEGRGEVPNPNSPHPLYLEEPHKT